MIDVIQVVQLPVGRFEEVARVDIEGGFEVMKGTLPTVVESLAWARRINPDAKPPVHIIVNVNGGTKDDVPVIENYLRSLDEDWTFRQNGSVLQERLCLSLALAFSTSEFVAIVPGNVLVHGDKWFEKLQQPFFKDPGCMMVGTDQYVEGNTLPPFRLNQHRHPTGPIFLLKRKAIADINWDAVPDGSHIPTELSKQFLAIGGMRWVAPSVRFEELEWQSPEPGNSDTTTLSGSPSPTTPDSSTVMITGLDGPGDSKQSDAKSRYST